MDDLCSDLILVHAFMILHDKIVFEMCIPRASLIIDGAVCNVAQALFIPSKLFKSCLEIARQLQLSPVITSAAYKIFIKQEVEKLLQEGIIEPSVLPWRTHVLVTKKEKHEKRIVIGYSQTINRFTELNAYPIPLIDEQKDCLWKGVLPIPLSEKDQPFIAFKANGKLYQYSVCKKGFLIF